MSLNLFEESKLQGQGVSLVLLFAVLVCSFIYFKSIVLTSQGSEYAKDRWAKRQANKLSANDRKTKSAQAQKDRKKEARKHHHQVRQLPPLESQASTQDFINLSVDASEYVFDHFGHLWLSFRELSEKFHFGLPSLDLSSFTFDPIHYYQLFKNSDVGKSFCEILDYLVALGWIRKIELSIKGVPFFATSQLRQKVTFPQLVEKAIEFGQLVYTRAFTAITTGSVDAFFQSQSQSAYDEEFTFLKSQKVLIDLGRGHEIDDVTFDRRLQECIDQTIGLLNACGRPERAYYSSRLAILRDIQSARTLDQKESIREKPYGILLFGGSGVGKSAIANSIIRYVLKVNGRDYSPRAMITLNQEDKFQSEFRTHHKGVILDDICNTALDRTEGSPTTPIIMFLNQVPMSALNPNAEMKGQVMIEPDVVCATTNVKDLLSNQLSNEPLSINRRFEVTITQKVRPEYTKTGTQMLDNAKIKHMAGDQFPDYALFTVEEPRYRENTTGDKFQSGKTRSIVFTPIEFQGKPLVDVDIVTLLAFLNENSKEHFAKQKAFVNGQKTLVDMPLCEHELPAQQCPHCALDSQASIPNYSDVVEYLSSLEEGACDWFTAVKKSLITSKVGTFIIAYLMRDVLKSIVLNSLGSFLTAVAMIVVFDVMCAAHCGLLLLSVIALYVGYVAVRFYFVRKNVVERFSHTTRPSQYFMEMDWNTRRKWIGALMSLGVWRLLVIAARKWKTLPTTQAAAPITLTPDAKPYQTETEFWDVHARERQYKFGDAGTTQAAKCTPPQHMQTVVGRRLLVVSKEDGSQCNALPIASNAILLPYHFVEKATQFVTVLKIGGHTFKDIPLSRTLCEKIPECDLCLWYAPGLGPQKDMTMFYPLDIFEGKKIDVYSLYNDQGKLVRYPNMTATRGRVVTTAGGIFSGLNYSFPQATFGGLCMATLIGSANGTPFIAGHHLAGRGITGAAGFVTRTQLLDCLERLSKRPGILKSHSATPLKTSSMGVEFGPLTAPHEKCPTRGLTQSSKIRIHGEHSLPKALGSSSAVVTSVISGAVAAIMGIPKQHGPPKDMRAARHKELDMAGKVDTAVKFDADITTKAYIDMELQLNKLPKSELAKLGKISDDANLAGLDGVLGINAMNFTTSTGFPLKGPKTQYVEKSDRVVEGISCPRDVDPLILEEVAAMEAALLKGESINAIFKGSLKDEPTKLTKDKVRVFAAANMPFVMLVRKYFLTLAALCQRNKTITECAVGTVVQSPEWTELFEHIGKHGWDRAIAGDYAKFDGRMSPQFMLMAFKLLITLAEKSGNYDADDLIIMRGIATEISYPTYDYFGTLVQFMGSNPSGHPLTVVINSLVNSLYMRYTYYSIAKKKGWWRVPLFSKSVSLMTYGDDNIMTVAKGFDDFNHTAIAAELEEVGIKYTMAEKEAESVPFINLEDASFLKHYAVYDSELGLYRSPVEEASIAKMLHTHLKSKVLTMEQSSAEAIQNVALKYFEFGREVYTERVEQLRKVAQEAGIAGYVGSIMTYDERLQWYREKYALESQSGYRTVNEPCDVNSEEEQLQLKAIAEMPLKCRGKEYFFPGGRAGDLIFWSENNRIVIAVEVKCCSRSGPKYRKVVQQATSIGLALSALYPKTAVYSLAYTYEGFEVIHSSNTSQRRRVSHLDFPFPL